MLKKLCYFMFYIFIEIKFVSVVRKFTDSPMYMTRFPGVTRSNTLQLPKRAHIAIFEQTSYVIIKEYKNRLQSIYCMCTV